MTRYVIWSRVERSAEGYTAVALAIPHGTQERCAPDERRRACPTRRYAEHAAKQLANQLRRDIHGRGCEVVSPK
jgi:hypothetical protein